MIKGILGISGYGSDYIIKHDFLSFAASDPLMKSWHQFIKPITGISAIATHTETHTFSFSTEIYLMFTMCLPLFRLVIMMKIAVPFRANNMLYCVLCARTHANMCVLRMRIMRTHHNILHHHHHGCEVEQQKMCVVPEAQPNANILNGISGFSLCSLIPRSTHVDLINVFVVWVCVWCSCPYCRWIHIGKRQRAENLII